VSSNIYLIYTPRGQASLRSQSKLLGRYGWCRRGQAGGVVEWAPGKGGLGHWIGFVRSVGTLVDAIEMALRAAWGLCWWEWHVYRAGPATERFTSRAALRCAICLQSER